MKQIIGWTLFALIVLGGFAATFAIGGVWAAFAALMGTILGTGLGLLCAYLICD